MSINSIKNDFAAYIDIQDKQLIMTVNKNLCKFYALESREDMRVFYDSPISRQFIYGFDEDNNKIAVLIEQKLPTPSLIFHLGPNYHAISTPLIIKGRASNKEENNLQTFDALTFYGGAIDSLYPPGTMALNMDNFWERSEATETTIVIRSFDDFTYYYPFELFGEKGTLLYSVFYSGNDPLTGTMGKLSAMISLRFDVSQPLSVFEKYYVLVKDFVAFCVGQHNITFDKVMLKRKILEGDNAGKYSELGICKVFDEYSDYASHSYHRVIPLRLIDSHIIDTLVLFADKETAPNLTFLPVSNREKEWLSYNDIKALCSALEYEYTQCKFPYKKQADIQGIKKTLKNSVVQYCEANKVDERLKQKALSAFKYLDISAVDMFCTLRDDAQSRVKNFLPTEESKKRNPIDISDEQIQEFVKMRNNITHGALITEWGEATISYRKLCRILYLNILARIGLSNEALGNSLQALEGMF